MNSNEGNDWAAGTPKTLTNGSPGNRAQPPLLQVQEGGLSTPQGCEAGPAAAGFSLEVKIAGAVYKNTGVSRGAQSVRRIQR